MTTAAAGSMKSQMIYVDTTAAVKRISDEQESDGLRSYLDEEPARISSDLFATELRRIGIRHGIDQVLITTIVDGVTLVPLTRDQLREAGLYPQVGLRSLDGLHLASALAVDAAAILAYALRLSEASRAHGMQVIPPK
ncbi:MAG TPA: PIN domain-containing protein [Actinomycetales bacterium]|nr:PIN domain-containing protein [Actinomycetales bacterium]